MKFIERAALQSRQRQSMRRAGAFSAALIAALSIAGCGATTMTPATVTPATPAGPQTYLASSMVTGTGGLPAGIRGVSAYTIDDTGSFSESSYQLISGTQEGILVYNAGTLIPLQRGLLSLSLEYQYAGPGAYTTCTPPMTCTGSYAFELPDHAGGLASIVSQSVASGQSFAPLVPAESCPDLQDSPNLAVRHPSQQSGSRQRARILQHNLGSDAGNRLRQRGDQRQRQHHHL